MGDKTIRSRNYCFTLNNYNELEYQGLLNEPCKYVVIGKEVGAEGTPHLQGFIVFSTVKSLTQVKRINGRAHWEVARGDVDANYTYCTKDKNFEEKGDKPVSQKRKGEMEIERFELARANAKLGKYDDIPADIYVRYYRTLKDIAKDHMAKPKDADDVTGLWIWGVAGSGKSRYAREEYPDSYLKPVNKWWDGFQPAVHQSVIIDDIDPTHAKWIGHFLKIWGDRYAFLAETKGGSVAIRPGRVVVTSQYSIDGVFEDDETRAAIHRRYREVDIETLLRSRQPGADSL